MYNSLTIKLKGAMQLGLDHEFPVTSCLAVPSGFHAAMNMENWGLGYLGKDWAN